MDSVNVFVGKGKKKESMTDNIVFAVRFAHPDVFGTSQTCKTLNDIAFWRENASNRRTDILSR